MQVAASAPREDVFTATVRALVKCGYQISHTDRESGIVVGARPLKQALTGREAGGMIRVTILIEESRGLSNLHFTWTPPEGALGSFKKEHTELVRELSMALPGVAIR